MKAIGYQHCLPVDDPRSLIDIELPLPVAAGRDLLVKVMAVSVNPVDTKVRRSAAPPAGETRVLGFDAAGIVEAVGPGVTMFKAGDKVWYAGSRARSGTNAQYHLVDERIVGHMPGTLDYAQAAAMPLTTITAWEALFDRLQLRIGKPAGQGTLLITGAAGGVGSIAVQLARVLTATRIVATASRPESRAHLEALGADVVIDHSQPLSKELQKAGIRWVENIFSVTHTHLHFPELAKSVAPQGRICVIDDPEMIDVRLLKARCASLHWEAMFTRSGFETADMAAQGQLLTETARLIDAGLVKCTHGATLGPIDAAHLRQAHAAIESNRTIGKIVLAGW
ncbi:MAG TPA: zinc-binding alcohol dehydrogenase family protein [Burkholderiaceae bacterium]|jgi:NADPH2:quinone reductase|nr:zinc-binding alcohol dehydrogenase family protein [Burkholderiaceae bacterium]